MSIKSGSDLWNKVCMPIYRELFKKATPSCDIDKLIKNKKEVNKKDWFMKYYLDEQVQQQIIKKHCKENKLSILQTKAVYNEIVLGFSPRGFKSVNTSSKASSEESK